MSLADWITGKAFESLEALQAPAPERQQSAPIAKIAKIAVATPAANEPAPLRAVLQYQLKEGRGGTIIDPEGFLSAVRALHFTHYERMVWTDLLPVLEAGTTQDHRDAAEAVRRYLACH